MVTNIIPQPPSVQNDLYGPKVRLVADLSAAAFRKHQDKELALWHCLRALNDTGAGYLSLERAVGGLRDIFDYSRRSIFRQLAKGESLFWERIATKRGSVIKIYSLKQVALMFNTLLFNHIRFYEVPAAKFDTLKHRRLALWASIYKPDGIKANPISHDSLTDYTGVQKRTQILYNKEADVRRTPCYRPSCNQKRLPNIYHHKQAPGHKGMLPRVRRFLKSFIPDEALETRRYFGSVSKLLRVKNRSTISYGLIRSTKRQNKGRLEWEVVFA